MHRKIFFFVSFLSFIFLSGIVRAQTQPEITVKATVDKKTLAQDEELVLKAEISASTKQPPSVQVPSLDDFDVLSSAQSQNYTLSKDNASQLKVVLEYILMPNKQGKLTIGPFVIKDKLKTYKSEPIDIEVGPPKNPLPEKPKEQEQTPGEEGIVL